LAERKEEMSEACTLVALIFQEKGEVSVVHMPVDSGASGAILDVQPVQAELALKEISKRAREGGVNLTDAVIAFKSGDGRVKVRQTKDLTTGKGAGRGTLMGFLVGLIFGGPLIGALGGLAIGAIIGRRTDRGLDDEFVAEVSKKLTPGCSALLLLADREPTEEGMAYLQSFDAQVFVTEMSREAEEAACQAADDAAIVEAMQSEFEAN
jgi:uncharacterized membrane protein